MNMWAWIGLGGVVFLTLVTLINKENRTAEEVRNATVTITAVIGILVAVLVFKVPYLIAVLLGLLAMILFNKKTYTKKRLLIYGSFILLIGLIGYLIFRDNPNYVLNHLKDNPTTTSLYVAKNGEEMITYHSDVVRPLASTVKMLIAIEYAMQIEEGKLDKTQLVSIDDLNRFYLKKTDGGAHEEWLKRMVDAGKLENNTVSLHDVAEGMMTYSSNANTDYLMHLLGIDAINSRSKSLGLTQHEEIYPLVSPLLMWNYLKSELKDDNGLEKKFEKMPMENYRELAHELSEQMKDGKINLEEQDLDLSVSLQKIWSDRLPGGTANDYGKLLSIISNDELPGKASETMRDLMEWPMKLYEGNRERFSHLGSKGGSTGFILNDALYAEDHRDAKVEIVILIDDFNFLQRFLLQNNINSFESKLLGDENYRVKVKEQLSGNHR